MLYATVQSYCRQKKQPPSPLSSACGDQKLHIKWKHCVALIVCGAPDPKRASVDWSNSLLQFLHISNQVKTQRELRLDQAGQQSFYCGRILAGTIFPVWLQLLSVHFILYPPFAVAWRWLGRRTVPSATLTPVSILSSSPISLVVVLEGSVFSCSFSCSLI